MDHQAKADAAILALRDLLEALKTNGDYGWGQLLPSQQRAVAAAWVRLALLTGRDPPPALPAEPPAPSDLFGPE